MTRFFTAIALCLAAAAAGLAAEPTTRPETVEIRLRAEQGQVTRQRIVTRTAGSMKMSEFLPAMNFSQRFEQELANQCLKVEEDGSATFETTFAHIATRMTMPGMTLDYDSRTFDPAKVDNEVARLTGKIYSALVGSRFTVEFGPEGEPRKVTGIRETLDRVVKQISDDPNGSIAGVALKGIIEQLASAFDDEAFAKQMQSYYRLLPVGQGPLRPGARWGGEWDMTMPILDAPCRVTGEYELAGIEEFRGRRCAKIRLKETFQMTSAPKGERTAAKTKQAGPLAAILDKMEINISSSGGEGIAYWDYEAGQLVHLKQTQRMLIETKVPVKAASTQPEQSPPMAMKQTIRTAVQLDLIEGDEPPAAEGDSEADTTGP